MRGKRQTLQDKLARLGLGAGRGNVTPEQALELRERERVDWAAIRSAADWLADWQGAGGLTVADCERLARLAGERWRQAVENWRADVAGQVAAAQRQEQRRARADASERGRLARQAKRQEESLRADAARTNTARQAGVTGTVRLPAGGLAYDCLRADWLAWLASRPDSLPRQAATSHALGWRAVVGQRVLRLAEWAVWRVREAAARRGKRLGDLAQVRQSEEEKGRFQGVWRRKPLGGRTGILAKPM